MSTNEIGLYIGLALMAVGFLVRTIADILLLIAAKEKENQNDTDR